MVTRAYVDKLDLEMNADIEVLIRGRLYWCKLGEYRDDRVLLIDMVEFKQRQSEYSDKIFQDYGTKVFSLEALQDIRRVNNSILLEEQDELDELDSNGA